MNDLIYDTAKAYEGLKEFPGAKHNPEIVKMFADTGNDWVSDDETPWCAAFVGAVLAQCGIQGTGRLNARSYLKWGKPIDIRNAERGDVVILSRGKSQTSGHVAFYDSVATRAGHVRLLGGNQGNAVSVKDFPVANILGVRRAPAGVRSSAVQSTTVQASAAQIATGAGGAVAAIASLDGNAQIIALVICAVTVAAAAWIMRERLRKWASGAR